MKRAPSSRPVRLLALAFAACATMAGLPSLRAQAANPLSVASAASAPAPATRVETVPAADIAVRADADERLIQGITRRAQQKDPDAQLGPRLDALASEREALARSYDKADLGLLSVVRLESLESHWSFYDRELAKWRQELDRVITPYADDAATLAERRAVWEATQQALSEGGVTSALGDRVAGILKQIHVAEQALSGPLEAQIRLGRRANVVQGDIDAGRKTVDAAIGQYDRRLAHADASPVWQAWGDASFTEGEIRGAKAGLRTENTFLQEWSAANHERLLAYQVAMVVALALLLWLAYRTGKTVADDPGTLAASRVLRRPVSAWLVLAFGGLPFFFPDGPAILHQFGLLVALIPVLRLLPPQVYDALGLWPYVATALYVAYRLSFLLLGEPTLYRLHLLGAAVVTVGALVWLLLSSRSDPGGTVDRRVRGFVRLSGWLAVAALLVAVVANAVGNVSLAEMLTGGVLDSTYIGLALYAGGTVLSSVLRLLVARRSVSRFRVITQHAGPLLELVHKLIMLAALVVWIVAIANEFRVARPVLAWVQGVLNHPLEAGQVSVTLGSILLFVLAIWVAFWVAKTVRLILRDEVLPKMALPRGVDNSIATLSYYGLVIVGLMFALAAAGFQTSQFAIVFGALGVGIGFGLQNIVNNFVSGLILMFERPIQPGDVVEVSGTSGKVRDIGMRATTLTTFEGADVIVPNGTLLSEKLINWTLSDMNRRIDVDIGVSYDADPRRVLELLAEIARGTPGIVSEPAPAVLFMRFGANALEFGIRAWTNDFGDWTAIRTEMNARVHETLRREGIDIPYPQQDLHLRSVSDEAAAQLAGRGNSVPGTGISVPGTGEC